jgi:hypothetical protein
LRNRTGIQRPKNLDENATSKLRQTVGTNLPGAVRVGVPGVNTFKSSGVQRPALGEVAVNRKVCLLLHLASCYVSDAHSRVKNTKLKLNKDKAPEVGQKRTRSSSIADGPQRVPLAAKPTAPVQTTTTGARSLLPQRPPLVPTLRSQRVFSPPKPTALPLEEVTRLDGPDDDMDVEEPHCAKRDWMDDVVVVGDDELENMIDEQDRAEVIENLVPIEEADVSEYIWPEVSPNRVAKYQREVDEVRARFDAEDEEYDTTMCSEYAEEIFLYMLDLQVRSRWVARIHDAYIVKGRHHAHTKLYGRPERDHLEHASNSR